MTLINFDGFDTGEGGGQWPNEVGDANGWDNDSDTGGVGGGRFSRGGSLTPGGGFKHKTIGSNAGEILCGGAFWVNGAGATVGELVRFYDGTTLQCVVCKEIDGSISLRRTSSAGTIVAQTAAATLPPTSLFYGFAFRTKFSATVGEFEVFKEGVSIYTSASNLNNIVTANAYATKYWLGFNINSATGLVDDWYALIVDGTAPNSYPGDATVYTLYPNGAGSSTQWTPDSGTNYQRVNEANGAEDGSYVADSVVGHLDEYTLDNMPAGFTGTILAVQGNIRARKDDAGLRQIALRMKSGATTQDGTTMTLGGAYSTERNHYVQDWDSVGAWTKTIVDALKLGPVVIT